MYDIDTLKEIDRLSTTTMQLYEDYRNNITGNIRNALINWLDTYNCEVELTTEYLQIELPKSCMLSATQLYAIEHVLSCEFIQTVNTDMRKYQFRWV